MFNSSSGGSPSSTLEDCASSLLDLMVTSWHSGPTSTSLQDGITRLNQLPDSTYQKLPATQKFLVFISDKPPRESSRFIPKNADLEAAFNILIPGDFSDVRSTSTLFDIAVLLKHSGISDPPSPFSDDADDATTGDIRKALLGLLEPLLDILRSKDFRPDLNLALQTSNAENIRLQTVIDRQQSTMDSLLLRLTALENKSAPPLQTPFTSSPSNLESSSALHAVALGHQPGIYLPGEADQHFAGLKRAIHKKFQSTKKTSAYMQAVKWLADRGVRIGFSPPSGKFSSSPVPAVRHPPITAASLHSLAHSNDLEYLSVAASNRLSSARSVASSTSALTLSSKATSSPPPSNSNSDCSSSDSASTYASVVSVTPPRHPSRSEEHSRHKRKRLLKELVTSARRTYPLEKAREPVPLARLNDSLRSEQGLNIFTLAGSIVQLRLQHAHPTHGIAQRFKYTLLVGPASDRNPKNCGVNSIPSRQFPQSRAQLEDFFIEQEELLKIERDLRCELAVKHQKPTAIPDRWYYVRLDHLNRFRKAATSLVSRVMGNIGHETRQQHHVTVFASIAHILFVNWQSAMAHSRLDLLGDQLPQQWDMWYKSSIDVIDNIPTQRVDIAMQFLGYSCAQCHSSGWAETFCKKCAVYGPPSSPVNIDAKRNAAFASWLKTNPGKSRKEWAETAAAKALVTPKKTEYLTIASAYLALSKNQEVVLAPGSASSF
jgi:hypothetical protein